MESRAIRGAQIMADVSPFRTVKHAEPDLLPTLARNAARRRHNEWMTTALLMLVAFIASAGIGGVLLGATPIRLPGFSLFSSEPVAVRGFLASFPICAGPVRNTCVVDGDTFWFEGVKYRVADIDTPEVAEPACMAERTLGRRATERLAGLLSAGPFHLEDYERDEDVYGRKLRIVTRGGESLCMLLVDEGLAHRWDGSKHGWC
jgi:micrococcal nuclease